MVPFVAFFDCGARLKRLPLKPVGPGYIKLEVFKRGYLCPACFSVELKNKVVLDPLGAGVGAGTADVLLHETVLNVGVWGMLLTVCKCGKASETQESSTKGQAAQSDRRIWKQPASFMAPKMQT